MLLNACHNVRCFATSILPCGPCGAISQRYGLGHCFSSRHCSTYLPLAQGYRYSSIVGTCRHWVFRHLSCLSCSQSTGKSWTIALHISQRSPPFLSTSSRLPDRLNCFPRGPVKCGYQYSQSRVCLLTRSLNRLLMPIDHIATPRWQTRSQFYRHR